MKGLLNQKEEGRWPSPLRGGLRLRDVAGDSLSRLIMMSNESKRNESTSTARPLASESNAGPANDALITQPISSNLVNIDGVDAISSVLSKYRLQTNHFTSVLEELHAAIVKEKEELDKAKEALEEERRKFHEGECEILLEVTLEDQHLMA